MFGCGFLLPSLGELALDPVEGVALLVDGEGVLGVPGLRGQSFSLQSRDILVNPR